jgi:hypothetical protein
MNETETKNNTIVKETYSANQSDSDSDSVSWHCGCPCDPWPDDMFQGYGTPDAEYEENYEKKKEEGQRHHICSKQTRTNKQIKKIKKKKVKKEKRAEKAKEANRIAEEDKGF